MGPRPTCRQRPLFRRRSRTRQDVRLGSLCTGIGGLDLAVCQVLDAEPVWCSEIDAGANAVLDARFAGVANVGDFTTADLEPVDVLTGGFPCQPVSQAGKRQAMDDDRWLFDDILTAVRAMVRPGCSCSRTSLGCSLLLVGTLWPESLRVWPRAGTWDATGFWAAPTLAAATDESASGSSRVLRTPTSRDWRGENQRGDESCLPGAVRSISF